jgi:hypothetical protein
MSSAEIISEIRKLSRLGALTPDEFKRVKEALIELLRLGD